MRCLPIGATKSPSVFATGWQQTMMHERLDKICDKFESDMNCGRNVSPRDYLSDVSAQDQHELLNLLLQIQLEIELNSGGNPDERHFHRLYPDFPQPVALAFARTRERFPSWSDEPRSRGESLPAETTGIPVVTLTVTEGPHAGKVLRFTGHQTCIVGRASDAHLRLSPNREFSRYHCRLEINPPKLTVVDLGSTNGTIVNGRRVQVAELACGDVVSVGDASFEVHVLKAPGDRKYTEKTEDGESNGRSAPHGSVADDAPRIAGYVLDEVLGQGSMGTVYHARRIATNESCAIKIIPQLDAFDRRAVARFRREASIVLRLQHRRIVRTFDFSVSDDGVPFLVMEYIQQVDFQDLLRNSSLANRIRMAASVIVRVLEGLQYAHEREIVHRDVKPANLLVFQEGRKLQVKLADFGLAKNFIDAGFSDLSTSNEVCGTLAYMPPEQVVDCRYAKPPCDIYASGVCLYRMLSGRLPYESEKVSDQIALILNEPPTPLAQHVPDLPEPLVDVVHRALARDARDRFNSATRMRECLLPFSQRR